MYLVLYSRPRVGQVLGPSDMTAIACGLKHTQTSSGVRILVCIACYTNTGKIRFLARILPVVRIIIIILILPVLVQAKQE